MAHQHTNGACHQRHTTSHAC